MADQSLRDFAQTRNTGREESSGSSKMYAIAIVLAVIAFVVAYFFSGAHF